MKRNDFIFFYGAADRKNAFMRVIDYQINDFNNYKEESESDFKKIIEEAYKRRKML